MRRWGKTKRINTEHSGGKPTFQQQQEFLRDWNSIVPPVVKKQSRKDKTVIYGARAVNAIVGKPFSRPTKDFDVFSHTQRKHALQVEQHIDRSTGSDMAYIEHIKYSDGKQKGKIFRVLTCPHGDPNVDYSPMPKNVSFVTKKGVRYESLNPAKKKYHRMIKGGERPLNSRVDIARIDEYERIKKAKKRGMI